MRYTEKEIDNIESFTDYCKRFLQLLFTSQLRLFMEITTKLLFIKKEQLEKLLLTTSIIAFIFSALQIVIGIFFRSLNLFYGTLPIVFQLGIAIIILILYFIFRKIDIKVYSNIENMVNIQKSGSKKETIDTNLNDDSKVADFVTNDYEKETIKFEDDDNPSVEECNNQESLKEELFNFDVDDLEVPINSSFSEQIGPVIDSIFSEESEDITQYVNEDLLGDPIVKGYQEENYHIVDEIKHKPSNFTAEELEEINRELEDSVNDESLFDDATIDLVIEKFRMDENLESSDIFSTFKVPDKFNMLS